MKLPHGGGLKLTKHDPAYAVLRQWIAEGCQPDADDAAAVREDRGLIRATGRLFEMAGPYAAARGASPTSPTASVRDVTELACYSSSDSQVADVTAGGLVVGQRPRRGGDHRPLSGARRIVLPTFVKDIPAMPGPIRRLPTTSTSMSSPSCGSCNTCPPGLASDEEFLRRVYLDVIGQLPTLEETKAFLADRRGDKRAKLIDKLLDRPEHAKFWALKWGDLLRLTSTPGRQQRRLQISPLAGAGVRSQHALRPVRPRAAVGRAAARSTIRRPTSIARPTDTQDCVESISQLFLGARCSAPSATTIRSSAGRRTTTTAWPRSSTACSGKNRPAAMSC